MNTKLKSILTLTAASSLSIGSSHAVLTAISTSTPAVGETGDFSDGGTDYFGVVTGGQIAGTTFSSGQTSPPEGSLAGRDLDDGNTKLSTRTATWSLPLPGGAAAPFTSIVFKGSIAARDVATNGIGAWDNPGTAADDFVTFELFLDGVSAGKADFRPDVAIGNFNGSLALDTNNDGVGDGTLVTPTSGFLFNINAGVATANTSVTVVLTTHSDSGNEEFWTSGSLEAVVDVVPEPSSTMMLGLAGGLLAFRRKK